MIDSLSWTGRATWGGIALAAIGLGTNSCGPARSATNSKPNVETVRFAAPPVVSATLSEDKLIVKVELPIQCQLITQTPTGEHRSRPTTCDTKPYPNAQWTVKAGRIELEGTTDANGLATIEFAKLVDGNKSPESAAVTISLPGGRQGSTSLALGTTPAYAAWRTRNAASEAQRAAQAEVQALEEVEQGLLELEQLPLEPWSVEQAMLFMRLRDRLPGICGKSLTADENRRRALATSRMGDLAPRVYSVRAAEEEERRRVEAKRVEANRSREPSPPTARQNAQVAAIGRQLVLSKLRSPSTASFAGDAVLLECPSGFRVTAHDVDAQNGFGAMIRNRMCVKFNPSTRTVLVETSEEGGVSVDADCKYMTLDCKRLDESRWTRKF